MCSINNYQYDEYDLAGMTVIADVSCEDFTCGDNFVYEPPTIELQRIYSSTYKGIDYCNKGIEPVGQFIPLFDADDDIYIDDALKDELIVPFDVEACYNSSANNGEGGWQFSINSEGENNFKLRSLIFTCEDNIKKGDADNIISSFADLNAIPDAKLCQALKDLDNMRPYPFGWEDRTPEEYYLLPSAIEHEGTHSRRFEENIIEIALGQKTDLLGEKLSFNEHLNFQPYCTDLFDSKEEAARRTKDIYEELLAKFSKIAKKLYKIQAGDSQGSVKEKQAYRDNENYTQWNDKVQEKITDYILELEKICKRKGIEVCEYTENGKWKEFEKYENDI